MRFRVGLLQSNGVLTLASPKEGALDSKPSIPLAADAGLQLVRSYQQV